MTRAPNYKIWKARAGAARGFKLVLENRHEGGACAGLWPGPLTEGRSFVSKLKLKGGGRGHAEGHARPTHFT